MKLLEYLENKVAKYQTGGAPLPGWLNINRIGLLNNKKTQLIKDDVGNAVKLDDKMDVDVSAEELLTNVKHFYLQHPTLEELNLFQKIFDVISRDPFGFFKLFKIKSVLPISSVNGIIIVIETRSKKNILDNQLLVKIPQNLQISDSITYEWYIGQVVNTLRINRWSDNFALVYGLINCGFDSVITDYITKIAKLKKEYNRFWRNWSDRLSIKAQLEIEKVKLDLHIMSKNHLCEGQSFKPHIIYEYLRNIKTNKTETLESYIKRLTNPDLDSNQKQNLELNIIKIMIMIMYSLQVAQDHLDFVHYDLHLGNILVVELEKPELVTITYDDKKFTFMLNAFPHIIDYGRSYVNPKTADNIINASLYTDVQLGIRTFDSFKTYQNALFKKQYYSGQLTDDEDRLAFNKKIFHQIHLLLNREGPDCELYYCKDTNVFYIVKVDAKIGKYTNIANKQYIIEVEHRTNKNMEYILIDGGKRLYIKKYDPSNVLDKNDMTKWLSTNIYNKDLSKSVKDLIKKIDDELLLNHYDVGIHSNKANKKYDMFRICKLVCGEIISIINTFAQLQYGDIWNKLNNQLIIEYPFYIDSYNVLPCDYHITDFFNISKSNTNQITKTWLKTPKDIADYLTSIISTELSAEMQIDQENSFQISK